MYKEAPITRNMQIIFELPIASNVLKNNYRQ
jgi:hypothetical protein